MATKKKLIPPGRKRTQTIGCARLRDWLDAPGNSQGTLADLIGVTQPAIAQWRSAFSRPTHKWRLALEKALGIPAVEWMTASERRQASGDLRKAG